MYASTSLVQSFTKFVKLVREVWDKLREKGVIVKFEQHSQDEGEKSKTKK